MRNFKIDCYTTTLDFRRPFAEAERTEATLLVQFRWRANNEFCYKRLHMRIIHLTSQNRNFKRYEMRNNVRSIATEYLSDGKVIIWFKKPHVGLMIETSPEKLLRFLNGIKRGLLRNKLALRKLNDFLNGDVSKVLAKVKPAYTEKPPITLAESLNPTNLLNTMDSWRYLTALSLQYNQVKKLPPELGNLSLTIFIIHNNIIGLENDWQWLHGDRIRKSLKILDLSENQLSYFPLPILKLEKLSRLSLRENCISRIPFGLRCLKNLILLNVSSNELKSLPSDLKQMDLYILKIERNPFKTEMTHQIRNKKTWNPSPLWLAAARVASETALNFTSPDIPFKLREIIYESPKCACGRLCSTSEVFEGVLKMTFENVKYLFKDPNINVYGDVVVCGANCKGCRDDTIQVS